PDGRAAQLLHAFRTRFDDIRFHLEVHPASLGPRFREEIRNAVPGQLHLEAGVQTLEPEALRLMDRDFDTAKTLDGLEFLCGVSAVAVHTDIIAGCPGQTAAGIFRDLRRLMALRPAELQMEIMKMLHGTPLRRRAWECGIRFSPLSPYDVIATPSLSAEDILRMRLLSRMVDCWYNSPELQAPFAAMVESSEGFLEEFLNFAALKYAFDAGPAPALRHRFLWLHEYMEANSAPEAAREALALQWLRCAFPAGEGPAAKAENSRGIPAEAEFISGTPCTGRSGIRSVRVPLAAGGCIYLAYDRGIAPNRATAEYML
ncbi:MAG: DUF4080 domain-containing protein, partial [Victivallales bacterium]|nr:DUF4080 domain-containing protein [Victivallales bacterium]